MKTLKIMIVATMLAAFFAVVVMASAASKTAGDDPFDAAATYKTKCVACHGAKAEKKFDPALAEADLVQVVLNGKKMEKPPNMPAYGEKGVTAEQAKALVELMKQLKSAP